jgi:PhnA domain
MPEPKRKTRQGPRQTSSHLPEELRSPGPECFDALLMSAGLRGALDGKAAAVGSRRLSAIDALLRCGAIARSPTEGARQMSDQSNDDYVYDEAIGEWRPASELAAEKAKAAEVRDASGNVLADGDSVVLVKDL